MALNKIRVIHPVQVIAGENQVLIDIPFLEQPEIFTHGVSSSFEPTRAFQGLLGRQHFDKSLGEACHAVSARNMPVERGRVKLRQNVNPLDLRVDAVTDGNID